MRTRIGSTLAWAALAAFAGAAPAQAQDPGQLADQTLVEKSCESLSGGTVNTPDRAAADPSGGLPESWPEAPAGLLPDRVDLRTQTQTFNRLYEFATAGGQIYGRRRAATGPWRELPLPLCFAGRVESISLDDDEMVALDKARRVYTMDNALKDAALFNWSKRWGPPTWTGPGYTLPGGVRAWSWSVISPVEDHTWTDPAGNRTTVGDGKVSHIWGLRDGGQRLTFWDPWLPLDESYEMCGPERGRFKAVNMSASGSFVFVVGAHGDMFTRIYDFDISGHDPVFFKYSYEDQRGKGDGAPIQLPASPWVGQPKVPGEITSAISIHKVGLDAVHRILRVEGRRGGSTGYWERDAAAPAGDGWTFHATGLPLSRAPLTNTPGDTSGIGLGASEDARYVMRGDGISGELLDYNVYCSPARVRIQQGDKVRELTLHSVDGLRQAARGRGLDGEPREQFGALEEGGRFTNAKVEATRDAVVLPDQGWTFERVAPGTPAARRCLPRRARIGSRAVGAVHLRMTQAQLLHRLPAPRRQLPRAWRWCVDGGGTVTAAFTRDGRVALVTTTAPGHRTGARRIHPGGRLGARRTLRVAAGLVRTSRRESRLIATRRGRVRFVAVTSRGTAARPRIVRAYLRHAGIRVRR